MTWFFIIALFFIITGVLFLIFVRIRQKGIGVLRGKKAYQDSDDSPGEILTAKTLPLKGKPDFILEEGMIPVEVKTGKTPRSPYQNHVMQLMAYCLLIEETYGTRPIGGIIRYDQTNTEFKLAYTKEAEESVRKLVTEMLLNKQTNKEFHCKHPEHN